jgi:16S rRNA (cytidine1402-2'-O)-methyltransferase
MSAGRVVLVGTPIGNLGDLTPRAVEALAGADVICCEDTRRTRKLLTHAGVSGIPLVALHRHNEAAAAARAVRRAAAGATVALVTDAGMPAVSDPGARLVSEAVAAGVAVTVVPGPSAVVAAVAVSGFGGDRFCFEGFLPSRGGERSTRLAAIAGEPRPSVIYEAPHRVARTIHDLGTVCGGNRQVVLARELTKIHEGVWRGDLTAAGAWIGAVEPRGEWVVVLAGAPPAPPPPSADEDIVAALSRRVEAGDDRRRAVAGVAAELGVAKRRVYDLAVKLGPGPAAPHLS